VGGLPQGLCVPNSGLCFSLGKFGKS